MKKLTCIALFWVISAHAGEPVFITEKSLIDKIVNSVPGLSDGARKYGFSITSIAYSKYDDQDIQMDHTIKAGDFSYEFNITKPKLTPECRLMLGSLTFNKRGNKWIPTDKSAIYFSTGNCKTPE